VFGLIKPKLPVTPEQQRWIDNSFQRLSALLGAHRLLQTTVVLPTPEHFPDPYDRSEIALQHMFHRVAAQMQVDPGDVDVTLFASGDDLTRGLVPFYSDATSGAAGLYHHDPADRPHISINEAQLKDPMALVAVLAHELGHIILLRPGLVDRDDPDMEPLNDLLTVFLGFGIFTANAAFRFEQHSDNRSQGWSARRLGYLSEEQFGYALARFAFERGEEKPAWISFLSTNIASYLKRSAAWLTTHHEAHLFPRD
jgi:PIN domain nuclease of toxin-antitoxin system